MDYFAPMDQTPPPPAPAREPELAPPGSPLHVAVAPGLLNQEHAVIRAEDASGEDCEAPSRLLAAALAFARHS
jgi:hypothetical protein